MKKILYFCNCDLSIKNGHGQSIRVHHKMLDQLFPNRITTIMISDEKKKELNIEYINLPHPSQVEKAIAVLNGYTPDLSLKSIQYILNILDKNDFDSIFIESSMFGNLIRKIKKMNPKIKVIVYFTDIEADLLKQEMRNSKSKRRIVCKRLIENEKLTVAYADKMFVLNKRDAHLFENIYCKKPDAIIPQIISKKITSKKNRMHYASEKLSILFLGGDFWPNVTGIKWFVEQVLPRVTISYELKIVGLNMENYKEELERKSPFVTVIGTVDNLEPFYNEADLFVAPINDGGGMKFKTAEALSYGKTFLGTQESLVGYWEFIPDNIKNNGIYLCSNEQDFAKKIDHLYSLDFEKCRLDIKKFIESLCSYDVNFKIFKQLFEE